ncbi:hypothetical protein [Thalassovita sp.]|uniref:hypothetical protein n=1 Tax=Thalassovita sp. TaxID=1979401 RepID=UPI002B273E65|nr:hypothetical protein [Thalassovita sp.]
MTEVFNETRVAASLKIVEFGHQPIERPPVHSLRLRPEVISMLPAKLTPNGVSSPLHTLKAVLSLRRIGQIVAMTAGENLATVQKRHTPSATARWAKKPNTFSAQVAGCSIQPNPIIPILPIRAMVARPVDEPHGFTLHGNTDRADYIAFS